MIKKVIIGCLGTLFLVPFLWVLFFGFIKTEYSTDKVMSTSASSEQINAYLTNPNMFPQWINGFERSRRVSSPATSDQTIYLIDIRDEGDIYKVIFTSTPTENKNELHQKAEHTFYTLEAELEFEKNESGRTDVKIDLTLKLDDMLNKVIAPIFASSVLHDYETQYERAFQFIE